MEFQLDICAEARAGSAAQVGAFFSTGLHLDPGTACHLAIAHCAGTCGKQME